jgi:hypothetical protein
MNQATTKSGEVSVKHQRWVAAPVMADRKARAARRYTASRPIPVR